jgi:hypothetical protein
VVAAVVGAFYGIVSFIDSRIEKKLTDETTLRRVASMVRPSCIFDEKGSVIFDSGAMQAVESINLQFTDKKDEFLSKLPRIITVKFNKHLAYPPILSVLDSYEVYVGEERGPMFEWIFTIGYSGGVVSDQKTFGTRCRYRLEIL